MLQQQQKQKQQQGQTTVDKPPKRMRKRMDVSRYMNDSSDSGQGTVFFFLLALKILT